MATPVSEVSRRRRRGRIAVSLNKEGSFYPSFFPEHLLRNAFYCMQFEGPRRKNFLKTLTTNLNKP